MRLNGLLNGLMTITAWDSKSGGRNGMVEIRFTNFPLEPETVQYVSDALIQVVERGMEVNVKEET